MATFTQMASGNWRVQVRRKTRYVAETFRRRKDGEEWALEMERNIDRNGSSKPRVARNVRTFGDLIKAATRPKPPRIGTVMLSTVFILHIPGRIERGPQPRNCMAGWTIVINAV